MPKDESWMDRAMKIKKIYLPNYLDQSTGSEAILDEARIQQIESTQAELLSERFK